MRRILFIIFLLLLNIPQASKTSAYAQNSFQQKFPEATASEQADRFTESEDDIFSTTYERELLSRRIFKKSLRPLSRKEIIGWSFKTAKTNIFL
jgi:hypothetical protein